MLILIGFRQFNTDIRRQCQPRFDLDGLDDAHRYRAGGVAAMLGCHFKSERPLTLVGELADGIYLGQVGRQTLNRLTLALNGQLDLARIILLSLNCGIKTAYTRTDFRFCQLSSPN